MSDLRFVLEAVAKKQFLRQFSEEPHDVSAFAVFDEYPARRITRAELDDYANGYSAVPFELQAVPHDSRIAGALEAA